MTSNPQILYHLLQCTLTILAPLTNANNGRLGKENINPYHKLHTTTQRNYEEQQEQNTKINFIQTTKNRATRTQSKHQFHPKSNSKNTIQTLISSKKTIIKNLPDKIRGRRRGRRWRRRNGAALPEGGRRRRRWSRRLARLPTPEAGMGKWSMPEKRENDGGGFDA